MDSENLHTVLIEKLVPGGLGLARLASGMVVLVRYVLPGERVVVREKKRRKDFISATLHEILTPSPDRINPPCPLYGHCGGCDLQHATYNAQILLKKEILAESLQRAAGYIFSDPGISMQSALASPKELGYRQRIRLQVDREGQYGFFRAESHVLQAVSKCLLASPPLNTVLQQLQSNESFTGLTGHCTAFELLLNPDSNDTFMLLHFKRKPRPGDSVLAADIVNHTSGLSTILMQVEGYGLYDPLGHEFVSRSPHLSQTITIGKLQANLKLTWETGGFCQVNLLQNTNLISLVLKMVKDGLHKRVLDLYCGYGNFSLPVAEIAGEVLGIDSQNAAIRSGKRNAMLNGAQNCHFIKKQVDIGVKSLLEAGETFDTVILDPPRQGAAAVVSMLPALKAEQIIYISCNPATLARDLAILCHEGYTLSYLVPVDMFPQTHHMESVSLLKRTIR
jgi:23S rRNA (uracil1939-C5)-methyltransferase